MSYSYPFKQACIIEQVDIAWPAVAPFSCTRQDPVHVKPYCLRKRPHSLILRMEITVNLKLRVYMNQ